MPAAPEDRLTDWLKRRSASLSNKLIGDDAALLPDGRLAVTVDQQIAGVHFPADLPAAAVGRRLVAVNLSDIAAVGGIPRQAVLAVGAPPGYPLRALLGAVADALEEHGATLAGGDLARSDQLATSLTLLASKPTGKRWVRRDRGRPGDRLWAGGSLGESALGQRLLARGAKLVGRGIRFPDDLAVSGKLGAAARRAVRRHIEPVAQLELGRWLGCRRRAAAIDVSDGLLRDLDRLCRVSGVGASVDASRLPTAPLFAELAARCGLVASDLALAGGEDYVLLFALPPKARPPLGFGAFEIGELRSGRGIRLSGAPLPPRPGWDHLEGD